MSPVTSKERASFRSPTGFSWDLPNDSILQLQASGGNVVIRWILPPGQAEVFLLRLLHECPTQLGICTQNHCAG